MKREIKFRCWDPTNKLWSYWSWDTPDNNFNLAFCLDPHIGVRVTQYTGLKDKNGKEIYEGDILASYEGEDLGWERHGVVTYLSDRAQFWLMEPPTYEFAGEGDFASEGDEWKHLEILGNIHENPELLTL